jgi:putative acetyltransferase
VIVRDEEQQDQASVRAVNTLAFDTVAEANLVNALRDQVRPVVSLVAEEHGAILGHIMFSPVSLGGHDLPPTGVPTELRKSGLQG